jgi:hypothetical protein
MKTNLSTKEIHKRNAEIAKMLGYELITPDMRKNPERWYIDGKPSSYWQKDYPEKQDVLSEEKYNVFYTDWNYLIKALIYVTEIGWSWDINSNDIFENEKCISCTICNLEKPSTLKLKHISKYPKDAVFMTVSDFSKLFNNDEI